ncbi:MAG: maltokinase N-terminal cap-like domain-containing protein [Hyphomicrobiales bacterium]
MIDRALLGGALARTLPSFLPGRRWYGAKARALASVALEDAAWLGADGGAEALAVVAARYEDGGTERYALLVALRDDPRDLPVLGRYDGTDASPWLVEATGDPAALALLLARFDDPGDVPTREGVLRIGDVVPPAGAANGWMAAAIAEGLRPLGVEQSNTSVRVGRRLVWKLLRRVESGENPEVEIGRFLTTRTTFRAVPALRGSATLLRAGSSPVTVGVLQDWIENEGDGWSWTIERLRGILGGEEPAERLAAEIAGLGRVTADFHLAISSDPDVAGFAPEPPSLRDWESLHASILARCDRVAASLDRAEARLEEPERAAAQAFLRRRDELASRLPAPDRADAIPFRAIRVHGDYHLGQTLKVSSGFLLIDFEGEPARPLAERRRPQSALKDVAGMLRSFDYAWEVARAGLAAPETPPPDLLRAPFLESYRARVLRAPLPIVPGNPERFREWISVYELDKALYEVEYELNHRPTWLGIPLRGVLATLDRMGS